VRAAAAQLLFVAVMVGAALGIFFLCGYLIPVPG
jgi:hypothetical protein